MTDPTPTTEAVAATLQDYLRVATATGALRGTHVEFTRDGVEWFDLLIGDDAPAAARATVHRDGEVIPTRVTVIWGESLPAEGEWNALWVAKPHALFGAFVLRAALRRAFADVLGDRREPDDHGPAPETSAAAAAPLEAEGDAVDAWIARVERAETAEDVAAVRAEAAGRITQPLHNAMRRRLRDLEAAADAPAEVAQSEPPTAMQLAMRDAEERAAAERDAAPKPTAPKRRATRKQG